MWISCIYLVVIVSVDFTCLYPSSYIPSPWLTCSLQLPVLLTRSLPPVYLDDWTIASILMWIPCIYLVVSVSVDFTRLYPSSYIPSPWLTCSLQLPVLLTRSLPPVYLDDCTIASTLMWIPCIYLVVSVSVDFTCLYPSSYIPSPWLTCSLQLPVLLTRSLPPVYLDDWTIASILMWIPCIYLVVSVSVDFTRLYPSSYIPSPWLTCSLQLPVLLTRSLPPVYLDDCTIASILMWIPCIYLVVIVSVDFTRLYDQHVTLTAGRPVLALTIFF